MKLDLVADLGPGDAPNEWYFWGTKTPSGKIISNVEMDIPEIITFGVNLARVHFKTPRSVAPCAYFDSMGHGENLGLVFYEGIGKSASAENPFELPIYQVNARISYGPNNPHKNLDPSVLERFHIGVYTARNTRQKDQPEAFFTEQMHFSMRWINGKFDNWNAGPNFAKNGCNDVRTSWHKTSQHDDRFKPEKLQVLPEIGHKVMLSGTVDRTYCGFDRVLLELAAYNKKMSVQDAVRLPLMSPYEGLDYTMNVVLPAAIAFATEPYQKNKRS